MKKLFTCLLALALVQTASAYAYITASDSQPIRWLPGLIPMHIKLGNISTSDGLTYQTSVQQAMLTWNSYLSTVQFNPIIEAQGPGTKDDHTTQVFFASDYYGTSFGSGTLAITLSAYYGNRIDEADLIFNTAYAWDSYRGNRTSNGQPYDIQRVALHELGHVLGLDHPDQHGQTVTAIMNSTASNGTGPGFSSLGSDDTLGAQNLYGVAGGAAPANDNFANAQAITLVSGSGQATGSNVYPNAASRESGEPQIVGNIGGHSVWWKWTAPSAGTATIDTRSSLFDTIMGVYTGSSVNALTLVGSNDDENNPGGIITSLVSFSATAGTTYYIAVDGYNDAGSGYFPGETGAITVHVTLTASGTAPTISNPSTYGGYVGGNAQFTVTASGSPAPTLQWQRLPFNGSWGDLSNTGAYSGVTTNTLTITNLTLAMSNDQFRCVATNASGTATSNSALLSVILATPPVVATQPSNQAFSPGASVSFASTATSATTMTQQWQRLPSGSGTWSSLSNVGSYSGVTTTTLTINPALSPMSGDQFRCVFTNVAGSATSNAATLTLNAPPVITLQPSNQAVTLGTSATYAVAATGSPTPTYQWQRQPAAGGGFGNLANTGSYSGVTTATLTVSNTTAAMTGDQFRCVATNSSGSATSNAASLTVTAMLDTDFNGNGSPDILLENTVTGQRVLWLMGGPNNAYVIQGIDLGSLDPAWHIVGTTDFNGDAKPDILLENVSSGQRVLWLMGGPNNAYVIQGLDLGSLDPAWHIVGTADFNGDAKPDILLENVSSGQRVLWLMGGPNNAYVIQGLDLGSLDPSWHITGTADFNLDGKPDILLENTSNGQRVLWLMGGPNNAYVIQGLDLGSLDPTWHIVK